MTLTIVAPDSFGSKGDEALIRGALCVFKGDEIELLTTNFHELSWRLELLDICNQFHESIVPFENISEGICKRTTLIIIGADVMDGTCGFISAASRIDAIIKNEKLGGTSLIFSSFRSDVDFELLERISILKGFGSRVKWYLRDYASLDNFVAQTGMAGAYFPDFAFYCPKLCSSRTNEILSRVSLVKSRKQVVVGLNCSYHSFKSFYDKETVEHANEYVSSVVNAIYKVIPDAYIFLITHDTRSWNGSWTDYDFALHALQFVGERGELLPKNITYPELLSILPCFDFIISGRMHLTIAAFRSEVIPILYTGDGSKSEYSMIDKCKGMFDARMGCPELVVSDEIGLIHAIDLVFSKGSNFSKLLTEGNVQNSKEEANL